MAMSEAGMPTRILALMYGSLYTYAAPSSNEGTAPGQIAGRLMRTLYRCDKLTRHTRVYGVIADPVGHSKSPVIHNRGFQARRLDAVYVPFLVPARNLREWMELALAIPVSGFSVTIPHKQRISRYLDFVEPFARRIGAVNTVWRKGGKWRGANTDVDGVLKPLARRMRTAGSSILIAGYGGAARAAAVALSDAGARITITGRNPVSAAALARICGGEALPLETAAARHYDALIHATPVGMAPASKATLFPRNVPADVIFDMVYNPRETALLKRAKLQGCQVICGSEMLLEQAMRQFEIWTGENAPRAAMSKALEDSLTESST
jgi:3-dehydroquinate dehydratase/shikimate dehydrogenase